MAAETTLLLMPPSMQLWLQQVSLPPPLLPPLLRLLCLPHQPRLVFSVLRFTTISQWQTRRT
jgi:hypothetical protein